MAAAAPRGHRGGALPFIVTATQIGTTLGKISTVTGAALVCAGLLSVLIFPLVALGLLRRGETPPGEPTAAGADAGHRSGPAPEAGADGA